MVHGKSEQNEWHDIEYQGAMAKAPAVLRKDPKNAVAAAKLVVSQRRRPLGLDGRQAKVKDCLQEFGQGNA